MFLGIFMVNHVTAYKPKDIFSVDQPKSKQKLRYASSERAALGLEPQEEDIQKQVFEECYYIRFKGYRVSEIIRHIPNGGNRSKSEGANFKKMGVIAGTPDWLLPVPSQGYGSLYIEQKTKTGRVRPEQKVQMKLLEEMGNKVVVSRTVAETIKEIKSYLGL